MNASKSTTSGHWVYCRYIRKNGRIIYPKNSRFFRFWVEDRQDR